MRVPCCDPCNHQSMTKYFFIGIDGGASSCRARLRDMEGNLLGEGCGGPANIHLDLDLAKESVRAASRAAVRDAGLDEHILHCVHAGLGLAGAGLKSPCEQLCAGLSSFFASTVVATDAYIAWLGAHQGGNGGIVILGTGSSGLAIVDGRRIDVAGWGAEISDEAGGQRMGRRGTPAELSGPSTDEPSEQIFPISFLTVTDATHPELLRLQQARRRLSTPNWHRLSSNLHPARTRWPSNWCKRRQMLRYALLTNS